MPINKMGNYWLQWSICSNRLKWFHTQIASNTCNLIIHQLIWLIFVTLKVKTILIDCVEAQFQKVYNIYEISRHIFVNFFLGHAVQSLQKFVFNCVFFFFFENLDKIIHKFAFHIFNACPMHSPFLFVHLMDQNLSACALFCLNSLAQVNMRSY